MISRSVCSFVFCKKKILRLPWSLIKIRFISSLSLLCVLSRLIFVIYCGDIDHHHMFFECSRYVPYRYIIFGIISSQPRTIRGSHVLISLVKRKMRKSARFYNNFIILVICTQYRRLYRDRQQKKQSTKN